jgi:heme A synthase
MRRVAMLEMTMVYLVFLFLPFAFWRWRGRGELWAAATVCGVVMLVYALGTPNVGTLYRVRYAYLMVFVALGVLGAATLWRDRRARQRGAADRLIPGTAEQDRADV